jgi:hypothetical protein
MRVRTKIWTAIVTVCIAATIYEIPNAKLIWRYARTATDAKQKLSGKDVPEFILTEEIVAKDSEAADILKYCLTDPNDEELAGLVAKYPDNEFFLAQLAYKLTDVNLLDPRALVTLADRLIALSPNNAHYRYIKGWILLKPPRDFGREQDALEQFNLGNGLDEFYLPYRNYKQRVDKLSDRAGISPVEKRLAEPSETDVYLELTKFIGHAYGVYPKLDRGSFRRLSATLALTAKRLINNAQHDRLLGHGEFLIVSCEGSRLRYLDLSPAEAQQARFRLSQAEEIKKVLGNRMMSIIAVYPDLMKITLIVTVFTVFTFALVVSIRVAVPCHRQQTVRQSGRCFGGCKSPHFICCWYD